MKEKLEVVTGTSKEVESKLNKLSEKYVIEFKEISTENNITTMIVRLTEREKC